MDNIMDAYLWYFRLGHINRSMMNRLNKEDILEVIDCESLLTYESSLLDKMTKSSFIEKDEWASIILSLIHTDV